MTGYRRTAIIVGVLFIMATVNFMVGKAIYEPVLGSSNYLELAYSKRTTVLAGLLLEFTSVLAIPLIPAALFPILKQHDEGWGMGHLAFRTFEAVLNTLAIIGSLALLKLSQDYHDLAIADAAVYLAVGNSIQAVGEWAFSLSISLVFPAGALMFYFVLYRARLVPRCLSMWGLLAAALLLVGSMLTRFGALGGLPDVIIQPVIALPIAVNEMVLALYLIIKGFRAPTVGGHAARTVQVRVRTRAVGGAPS